MIVDGSDGLFMFAVVLRLVTIAEFGALNISARIRMFRFPSIRMFLAIARSNALAKQPTENPIALTGTRLFLPITDTQSELWMLENVNR